MGVARTSLQIADLHVQVDGKEILRGVTLHVPSGQVHALMGPNGSGKSTLAQALMGHPRYTVTGGSVMFDGHDVLALPANERSKLGLFLSFQYPQEVAGVSLGNFLRTAMNARRREPIAVTEFYKDMERAAAKLGMDESFITRGINEGFSGGEKKRAEILQMAMLQPKIAILDETDSGLDIDALRTVAQGINAMRGPEIGMLVITHYQRLLDYVKPDVVSVMMDGRIVKTGGSELAMELEQTGYAKVMP